MEPEVRERFERIEAIQARTAEDHRLAMAAFDQRLRASKEEFDRRHRVFMDELARLDEKAERRHRSAMERMDRYEARHEAAHRKIDAQFQVGARLIAKNAEDMRALKAEMRAFIKAQGNGRRGSNGSNGKR